MSDDQCQLYFKNTLKQAHLIAVAVQPRARVSAALITLSLPQAEFGPIFATRSVRLITD